MRAAAIALIVAAVAGGLGLGNFTPPAHLIEGGIPEAEPVAVMQPVEIVPEEEAVEAPVSEPEPIWEPEAVWYDSEPEPDYSEPYTAIESAEGGAPDLKTMGRVYADGAEWTWYSERALPGGGLDELNSSGRTVNDGGYVTDGDGYIAIASPDESIPVGTEVDTPWGPGRVYDYNPGDSWDVYTSWE